MNALTDLFSSPWIHALGWTLLHTLWQSLLCVILVMLVLRCVPSRLSNARYAIATAGLFIVFLFSLGTFLHLNSTEPFFANGTEKSLHQALSISTPYEYQSFRGLLSDAKSFIQANIPLIVSIWSIGAFLFLLRIFSGWWYIQKLRRSAIQIDTSWSQRIHELAKHLGISETIMLAESSLIGAPIVIGYIKPMILIPIGMCSGLSTEQLESIFIHELMHIRRGDYFVNMIQSFLEALFFFNPFVWMLSAIMRREREHCCDDAVVKVHGNALAYAHALATLEEVRLSKTGLALSLAENKNQLLNRIKRIMEKSVNSYSGRERLVPVVLLTIGLVCASWLTIQSGKSEQDFVLQSNIPNEITMASDTAIKEKSARYYRKQVTTVGADGNPKEEIVEEFEGDEDLRPMLSDMNFDVELAPIPAIPDLDFVIPPIPDFMLDTITPPETGWIIRDWDEFSREFEKNFKARFGDFYQDHEKELRNMMAEVERKFEHQFDDEWALKMQNFAFQQEQLARIHAEKFELNKDAFAQHEEQMKKFEKDMNRWEKDNATHLQELERSISALEEKTRVMEKELRAQLIKDGYIGTEEKINSIQVMDESIEINGKKIKASDQKKYKEIFEKHNHGVSEKELKKRFSDVLDGRKE